MEGRRFFADERDCKRGGFCMSSSSKSKLTLPDPALFVMGGAQDMEG